MISPNASSCTSSRFRPSRSTRGASTTLGTITLLVLFGGAIYGGYWWWSNSRSSDETTANFVLHTVGRKDFLLQVTERGEVESARVTEIHSEVKSKNTPGLAILKIVPEGTKVEPGDFLAELDSSALREERVTQMIAVNTSSALATQSLNVFETAEIAKQEYLEGTYVQERQTIESEVFVAEENLNRAKEYYEYSTKLAAKGYVNELQLQADKFAVEKSAKELEAAQTKLKVLDEFTRAKMLKQMESDIKIAAAKWDSDKKSLELETNKLQEIEDQITKCTITAPREGTVVYAHDSDRRGDSSFIVEEGAIVREQQPIIRLPDATAMQVLVKINESLIQFVKPGMAATISPVGLDDRVLQGTVKSVNRYAEPTSWRKANVREYKAYVTVDDVDSELRSGMTASVTIECDYVPDAMQVPVQSVYVHGDDYYCFVYDGQEWEARNVECGPTNDKFFVINGGLNESEKVSLNPRRFLELVNLPKLEPVDAQRTVKTAPRPNEVKTAGTAEDRTADSRSTTATPAGG